VGDGRCHGAHGNRKESAYLLIRFKDLDPVADEVYTKKSKGGVSAVSKWNIAKQLAVEFSFPLIVATIWVIYKGFGPPLVVADVIENFMKSFFLASWATSQIFRVRKQEGVESSFASLKKRLETMIDDFQQKSLWTINHITGGDSYCYAEPQLDRPSYAGIRWDVKNSGDFPMYQVTAKIVDLDWNSRLPSGLLQTRSEEVALGDIPCEAIRFIDWNHFGDEPTQHFTITFDSRNGRIIQDVRIKLIDGERAVAYRLTKDGEMPIVLKEVVPEHFPRDENGLFDWSGPTPEPVTFTGWAPPFQTI
jgi:hypothetical protein